MGLGCETEIGLFENGKVVSRPKLSEKNELPEGQQQQAISIYFFLEGLGFRVRGLGFRVQSKEAVTARISGPAATCVQELTEKVEGGGPVDILGPLLARNSLPKPKP